MTAVLDKPAGPPTAVTNSETGSRVYVHPQTGERFTSVTTILHVIAKDALHYWSAKVVQEEAFEILPRMVQSLRRKPCEQKGDDRCGLCRDCVALDLRRAPDRVRDEAGDRGSRFHAIAEHHVLTGETLGHADDIAAYVDQYQAFLAKFRPVYDASEMTVINRTHGYAGTLDAILRLGWCPPKYTGLVGAPVVADNKTGKGVYIEQALQLAAYRHAEAVLLPDGTEVGMPEMSDTGLLLHFRPENYWVRPVNLDQSTFGIFLKILDFYNWQHADGSVIGRAMCKTATST